MECQLTSSFAQLMWVLRMRPHNSRGSQIRTKAQSLSISTPTKAVQQYICLKATNEAAFYNQARSHVKTGREYVWMKVMRHEV